MNLRVRVSGPLAPYADGFRTVLAERGYRRAAGQLQLMAHLSRCWSAGLGGQDLTPLVEGSAGATRRGFAAVAVVAGHVAAAGMSA
jgi:hypothetical protein